nr:immunoglobulin heavy chain junction region [Homo sapiens]
AADTAVYYCARGTV